MVHPGARSAATVAGLCCRLVAEGVETEAESDVLQVLGVDLAQGYLFGRPERLPD